MIAETGFIFFIMILAALGAYGFFLSIFAAGWFAMRPFTVPHSFIAGEKISVIVPVRNEEHNIERLLSDLAAQDYPGELCEFIFVDDHSEDATCDILQEQLSGRGAGNFNFLRLEGDKKGKKEALKEGIRHARGKYIVTTDADCSFSPRWITAIAACFKQSGAEMIIGPVLPCPSSNPAGMFQEIEFLSLVGSGAGSSGAGKPFLANGANLAFSREAFEKVGGYREHQHIASGDDVFLLHAFKRAFGSRSIRFLRSREAIVRTPAEPGILSFFRQRKRWASKAVHYRDAFSLGVAASVFFINIMLFAGIVNLLFNREMGAFSLLVLAIKAMMDLVLLAKVTAFARRRKLLLLLPLFEFVYVFYSVITGMASLFPTYLWRGRRQR